MGSPEKPNKSTTSIIASTTSPQSTAFQDSPIFNYINNLSPIKPVKGTSVIQVFSGLSSPPLVFTSPQVRPHQQSIDLKSSHSQLSRQDDTGNISSGINLARSENSCLENPENSLLKTTDSMNAERSIGNYENEDNKGSYLLEEPDHDVEKERKNGNNAKSNTGQNLTSNVLGKVVQSQLGKRRRLQFEAPQEKNAEISVEKSAHYIRNSSSIVSKPSGIGLHLNSVVNAMPFSYVPDGGKKSVSSSSHMQDNLKKYPSISSNSDILENSSSKCVENAHEASNRKAESVKMLEYEETFDQVSLKSEQAERFDGMNRLNPKKKRKKTDSSGDGCKFCNCKKTKCLKLYCDCFAAGIYCADSCSCQGCFNRPGYEETVLETRQHIESRNPIAFAPKIVHRVTQSPRTQMLVEDGDQLTPIAGRHKRGCNCKKSMCLKKYCECYQANVGCSDGCRCEGCKNIYGTKGVSGIIGEIGMEAINEKLNDSFDDKPKVGSHKPHNLTPQTPSFQCSNHGKNVSKARVFPGNYVVSPESGCTFNPNPYYTSTPTSPNDSDMITEASNKNLEMVTFDQESYPNIEFTDEISPGDWSNNNSSRPQLLGCSSVGLCFRGSPVTLFSGTKPSFDDIIDDNSNTPEILKDSYIHQPTKVIATSPNKKRVSPPRIRLHELGSTSLKSGRKFILKAVPSFPPLTPCIDSKENTGGQTSNHPSGCNNL